ncbi:unnamed protein product [Fraxinus pennsylvanica]|uniref:Uncharacterized protein n=1 Tax=Fraxinus pennsylvanica TaxID=56036 RepID=A0AAD2A086_9LAMI|nr:unnamed protein product [Fraxinus pennsylvanica]
MAEIATEESEAGRSKSLEGVSTGQQQQCQPWEALAEWRSSEQLENGIPSTSSPYWDSSDDGQSQDPPYRHSEEGKENKDEKDQNLLNYMECIHGKLISFHKLTKENFGVMHLRLVATNEYFSSWFKVEDGSSAASFMAT